MSDKKSGEISEKTALLSSSPPHYVTPSAPVSPETLRSNHVAESAISDDQLHYSPMTHPVASPAPVEGHVAAVTIEEDQHDEFYDSFREEQKRERRKSNSSMYAHLLESDRSMVEVATSNMQTLMHLIKGNIGTGILAIPSAFAYAGLWTGTGGMLLICIVAVHCMHMLTNCSRLLCKRTSSITLDYANTVETALKTGPRSLRRFAKAGKNIVSGFLIFTQFGFCCVYIIFIAENVQDVLEQFLPESLSIYLYEAAVVALLVPYVCVRNLSMLAPFSAFANILTITGLVIIFVNLFTDMPATSDRPAFTSVGDLPMFFGTAIFAVEGISLVLPLENNMRDPDDFLGWNGVLNLGMVTVTALLTSMGFYGYLKYGDDAEGSITLNLPDTWLYMSVKLMFACAIFISYNVQFYVPIRIIWPKFRKCFRKRSTHRKGEYVFRIALVFVTFGIAAGIPHLDLLITLIGASASTALAIVIPACVELLTLAGEPAKVESKRGSKTSFIDYDAEPQTGGCSTIPCGVLFKNSLILIFGVVGWVTGTYAALVAIVDAF